MKTKRIIETDDEDTLTDLLGQVVTFFCGNYFYTGRLAAVNGRSVLLQEPKIVYETGPFTEKAWKDAQPLPHDISVMLHAVEAFGVVK